MELTEQQMDFARRCTSRWMQIHEKELKRLPNWCDADHSSLLGRLLSGKEPLDKPPPLRFSYPDYDLAEGKEVQVMEVWQLEENEYSNFYKGYTVCVDQHVGWKWIERDEPINDKGVPAKTGILEYRDGTRYRFYRKMVTRVRLLKPDYKRSEESEECPFLQKIKEEDNATVAGIFTKSDSEYLAHLRDRRVDQLRDQRSSEIERLEIKLGIKHPGNSSQRGEYGDDPIW